MLLSSKVALLLIQANRWIKKFVEQYFNFSELSTTSLLLIYFGFLKLGQQVKEIVASV